MMAQSPTASRALRVSGVAKWTEFLATGWSVVTPIAYYILLCSPFVIGVVVFLSRLVSFEIQFFI